MLRIDQIKIRVSDKQPDLRKAVCSKLKILDSEIIDIGIIRRSLDARKKPELYYVFSLSVSCRNEDKLLKRFSKDACVSSYRKNEYILPGQGCEELTDRPLIVGMGPAGLFCAYELARAGYKPLVIERGKCVEDRAKDVERFWETGVLDTSSNVQFGEGGAGTFSDGKLSTSVKDKDGRIAEVLKTFVEFGADEEILYDHMPHLGTDVLPVIVRNMRSRIIELGGEVRFETCLTGIECKGGNVRSATVRCPDGSEEKIIASVIVLAIGHSARDTYKVLFDSGLSMEQKPFAAGFRVQHPQSLINANQYGDEKYSDILGASPYKLTANFGDRGVFSFCMCPGGYVVNSSSEEGGTVVNGMSYSGRDSKNANSAIVVSIPVSDYRSDHPLAGIEYQTELENRAYKAAGGKIPAQRYGDFKRMVESSAPDHKCDGHINVSENISDVTGMNITVDPVFKGSYEWCDLSGIFDEKINKLFIDGMTRFGKIINGFDAPETVMAGVESRTSSPVRIPRDEGLEASIGGIIPLGEGAGYAGGITSAAIDGIRGAEMIIRKYSV
ncbi:MAG: NAD(P)-binding protein [Lachnospiraceae bacterium]|nr:NAD(P)-binding protein [Lachnospiraceae bacterium]